MPCDTRLRPRQSRAERLAETKAATAKLKAKLNQSVKVKIGPQGAITFVGWTEEDRAGVSDACAYRALKNSFELKMAIEREEILTGKKVEERAILAGFHSHDGGKTWGRD